MDDYIALTRTTICEQCYAMQKRSQKLTKEK